jgi:selenocysteine lyase/cysteine desulfurase
MNAFFIVDGTQSVGALPMDVAELQIDALVCAGYKWLMGPYSIGMAYYSAYFNQGIPLEESWMNRSNARKFSGLTDYVSDYTPGAGRYNVGEYSNFNLVPMLNAALEQVLDWDVEVIQEYCDKITRPLVDFLNGNNFWVEEDQFRAKHLFGFQLPRNIRQEDLMQKLQERKVFVSVRGKSIRVSPHVYNSAGDIQALIEVLKRTL